MQQKYIVNSVFFFLKEKFIVVVVAQNRNNVSRGKFSSLSLRKASGGRANPYPFLLHENPTLAALLHNVAKDNDFRPPWDL